MIKTLIKASFNDKQIERIKSISDKYEFVYEPSEDIEVVIGNYKPQKLKEFTNLKWIQTSAVGVDNYIKKEILNEGVILTNAVDVHSQEVAEHIFATLVSSVKKLHLYRDNQYDHLWKDEGKVKEYSKLKVCIVGYGDIGKVLAKLLKGIGVYVIGVKRTLIEKPQDLDELYTDKDLLKAISDVDVVVSILPGNKANHHLFTLDTFKVMRNDTLFINCGRGNLYSEEVLCEVLDKVIIAGASIDVFESEPLSKDSKLWNYKNLIITPHAAGSYHLDSALDKFCDLVCENLRRYANNEELLHIVKERE